MPPLVVVVDIDNTLLHASFDHEHWVDSESGGTRVTAAAAKVAAVAGCTLATCAELTAYIFDGVALELGVTTAGRCVGSTAVRPGPPR